MIDSSMDQVAPDLNVAPATITSATEILPNLFLGGMTDARSFEGTILCVRDEGVDYTEKAYTLIQTLLPVPEGHDQPYCVSRIKLEEAANFVKRALRQGPVLVHCLFGRDRSPLVVAWYLCKVNEGMTLAQAYEIIQAKRPVVINREAWIEKEGIKFTGGGGYPPVVTVQKGEQAKYVEMWSHPEYRTVAPGEEVAAEFLSLARPKPGSSCLDFGAGTGRGAIMLAMLGGLNVKMLDFAPNCLDDFVREALQTQPLLSFAECNLVKPIVHSAEYGYCTDVMEHIPPDWVTTVLVNILHSAQHVFFQIACTDDSCGKLIGETLHLSVHPMAWWIERLQKLGALIHFSQDFQSHCIIYCSAWVKGQDIVDAGILNVTPEQVKANVEANLSGPWIDIGPHETNDCEVAILGGGPSLRDYEDEIRAFKASGGKLATLNGAYHWARERNLFPVNQFVVDAREFNSRFTHPVDSANMYFIASQCDPKVLEGLPQERTFLWHTAVDSIREILEKHRGGLWFATGGGSTILLRAIPLLRMMGFKKFHLYGCDSCILPPDSNAFSSAMDLQKLPHHAYPQPENDNAPVVPVIVAGKTFYCHPWMISQAQEFMLLIKALGNEIELHIPGDGLLAWILEAGAEEADKAFMSLA